MAKCSRCGKRGLFLFLDCDGLCQKCADELFDARFKKLCVEVSPVTINLPPKSSPDKRTAIVRDLNNHNILVYDLTSAEIDKVLELIRSNPGILQRDLGKNFDISYRPAIRELLYHMTQQGLVSRSREKNTYRLYLCGNPTSESFQMPPAPNFITPEEKYHQNQKWQRDRLREYRRIGIRKVEWSCGRLNGRECQECLAKNGNVYWIDKHPKCPAHIGCTCMLTAVVELSGENVPVTGG